MRVIKENPVLSMGVLLPLILMAVFFISARLPQQTAPPTQYGFLFAVSDYGANDEYIIDYRIENSRLTAHMLPLNEKENRNNRSQNEKLYRYDPDTGIIRDVSGRIESDGDERSINLGDLARLQIDPNTTSPDGYVFTNDRYHNTGLIGDLFGAGRGYRNWQLVKGNTRHTVELPNPSGYYNVNFLGWIIEGSSDAK